MGKHNKNDKDEKIKDAIKKEGDSKDKEIKPGGIDKIQEKINEKDKS
jgi:hypothetical protein